MILIGVAVVAVALAFIPRGRAYDPVKRVVDLVLSIPAALVLSPAMLAAALAVRLDSKGPAFYLADRVGAGGRRIKVWKLRTMVIDADRLATITGGRDARITRVGRFLRATKIDELPQLFNIVLGTMTIVGPRPESTNVVERYYTAADRELFEVAPGLTCPGTLYYYLTHDEDAEPPAGLSIEEHYAQVSLPLKLAADLHYVRRRCLAYDVKLIGLTVFIMVSAWVGRKVAWRPDNLPAH